jgi:hypothetical protein
VGRGRRFGAWRRLVWSLLQCERRLLRQILQSQHWQRLAPCVVSISFDTSDGREAGVHWATVWNMTQNVNVTQFNMRYGTEAENHLNWQQFNYGSDVHDVAIHNLAPSTLYGVIVEMKIKGVGRGPRIIGHRGHLRSNSKRGRSDADIWCCVFLEICSRPVSVPGCPVFNPR